MMSSAKSLAMEIARSDCWKRSAVFVLFFCCLFSGVAYSQQVQINVIFNNNDRTHQGYVSSLKSAILKQSQNFNITETYLSDIGRGNKLVDADFYISVGVDAGNILNQTDYSKPTLFTLIPDQFIPAGKDTGKQGCTPSCYYSVLDQPAARQIRLLRYALPDTRSVGLLYSENSISAMQKIAVQAKTQGLQVHAIQYSADESLLNNLAPILSRTQLLYAIPDPAIYNRQTARSIILTTYRHRIPIFGYSSSYTRAAGALLSLYSSPEDFARHNVELLTTLLINKQNIRQIHFPRYFNITVNQTVARSMSIDIASGKELYEWLRLNDVSITDN